MSRSTTIVSAPGKVLLAGGYLLLDPDYTGTVIATSSRFYTCISTVNKATSSSSSSSTSHIEVRSPQFENAEWGYEVQHNQSAVLVQPVASARGGFVDKNKFVEIALRKTLALARAIKHSRRESAEDLRRDLEIVIVGDNDFYSQRKELESRSLPPTLTSLSSLPPFNHTHTALSSVHKTGLGSSAALITSLVASLLIHLNVVPPSLQGSNLDLVHNTAQFVHCLAQGKVGSGFDVSSAVYGGQVYKRFGEEVIKGLMSEEPEDGHDQGEKLHYILTPSAAWTNHVEPLTLPPNIRLLLADVDAGSDTPSLVGKVLKWRKENPEQSKEVYTTLALENSKLAVILRKLGDLAAKDANGYKDALSGKSGNEEVAQAVEDLRGTMAAIRKHMKRLGQLAGVPIEPDEQTRLLDECVKVDGVVGGGVPGAGGYDALFLLIVDTGSDETVRKVEAIWSGWKELSVCPLSCSADRGGLRLVGDVTEVKGLKEALL